MLKAITGIYSSTLTKVDFAEPLCFVRPVRAAWQIIVVVVLLLSYAASATAGNLVRAGWLPDDCAAAHAMHHSDGTKHSQDCGDSQDKEAGHCQCACHSIAVSAVVAFPAQFVPCSLVFSVFKAADETAQDGPVIGIDHPPQLA